MATITADSLAEVTVVKKYGTVHVSTSTGLEFFVPSNSILEVALRGNLSKGDQVFIRYTYDPDAETKPGKKKPMAEIHYRTELAATSESTDDDVSKQMAYGRIMYVNWARGFGFIHRHAQPDLFFHVTVLPETVRRGIELTGRAVAAIVGKDERGRSLATEVQFVDESLVPSPRLTGTVSFYNRQKGYGFISPDGETKDVYVIWEDVESSDITLSELDKNCRVTFERYWHPKGPRARDIEPE